MNLVPTVIEQSSQGERAYDIYSLCISTLPVVPYQLD